MELDPELARFILIDPFMVQLLGIPVARFIEPDTGLDVLIKYPDIVVLKDNGDTLEQYNPDLLPYVEKYLEVFSRLRE